MAFDITSAEEINENNFDINSAKELDTLENSKIPQYKPDELVMGNPENSPMRFLMPKSKDIPELAGSTALDVAGNLANASPTTQLIYNAVGGAGGEAYKQIADYVMEGKHHETGTEALKDILAAGGRGAASSLIGQGVGKGLKMVAPHVTEPFKKAYTAYIQAQEKTAKKLGIEPSMQNLSQSPFVQALSRKAEYAPWGLGQEITEIKNNAIAKLEDFADNTLKNMGEMKTPEQISDIVTNKFKVFQNALDDTKNKLYAAADKLIQKNVTPIVVETKKALLTAIETLKGSPETTPAVVKDLENLYTRYSENGLKNYSQLRTDARNIGNMIKGAFDDPSIRGNKSVLEMVYASMKKDLDSTAKAISPEFANAIDQADAVYTKGLNYLKQSLYKSIKKAATDKPSTIYTAVFNPRNPDTVRIANKIFGNEELNQFRMQWLDDLIQNSYENIEGEQIISPVSLAGNISKYKKILPEMFANAPEQLKVVNDLLDVSLLLSRGRKVAGGSETGFIAGMFNTLQGLMSSKLTTTEIGKKLLTSGIPMADVIKNKVTPAITTGIHNILQPNSYSEGNNDRR